MVNELAVMQLTPKNTPREAWRSEIETQRKAIYRDCPRDLVIDEEHALARVGGTMCGGAGAPMARRYLIKGLRADGFAESDIARGRAARSAGSRPTSPARASCASSSRAWSRLVTTRSCSRAVAPTPRSARAP